jgi:hypothetical protein
LARRSPIAHFFKTFLWGSELLGLALISGITFLDIHLLSRHSKRRTALLSTIAAIAAIFLMSSFLIDKQQQQAQFSNQPTHQSQYPASEGHEGNQNLFQINSLVPFRIKTAVKHNSVPSGKAAN